MKHFWAPSKPASTVVSKRNTFGARPLALAWSFGSSTSTPTFSPAAGVYGTSQTVSISTATAGATIYYTTNGTAPTTASAVCSGPLNVVAAAATIRALAVKSGLPDSAIGTAAYAIGSATSVPGVSVAPYAWWSPSAISTLTRDTAGSTPVTADGQGIGRIADRSGNARHLTQATAGNQHVFRTDGTHNWLDATSAKKSLLAATATLSGSFCIAWASRKTAAGSNGVIVGSNAVMTSFLSDASYPNLTTIECHLGLVSVDIGSTGATSVALSDHTGIVNVNAGAVSFYVNGTAAGSVTPSGTIGPAFDGLCSFSSTYAYAGRIYDVVIFRAALSVGDIAALHTWLAGRYT